MSKSAAQPPSWRDSQVAWEADGSVAVVTPARAQYSKTIPFLPYFLVAALLWLGLLEFNYVRATLLAGDYGGLITAAIVLLPIAMVGLLLAFALFGTTTTICDDIGVRGQMLISGRRLPPVFTTPWSSVSDIRVEGYEARGRIGFTSKAGRTFFGPYLDDETATRVVERMIMLREG